MKVFSYGNTFSILHIKFFIIKNTEFVLIKLRVCIDEAKKGKRDAK